MAMSDLVNVLTRSPSSFSLHEEDVTLHETPQYCGIYFSLVTTSGIRLNCHATIGHWQHETAAKLTDRVRDRILTRFKDALKRAFRSKLPVFSNSEAVQLPTRIIANLHVQGSLSSAMWGLQQTVQTQLETKERSGRRVNYHISVDSVSQGGLDLQAMD